jgi:hypothetical protein
MRRRVGAEGSCYGIRYASPSTSTVRLCSPPLPPDDRSDVIFRHQDQRQVLRQIIAPGAVSSYSSSRFSSSCLSSPEPPSEPLPGSLPRSARPRRGTSTLKTSSARSVSGWLPSPSPARQHYRCIADHPYRRHQPSVLGHQDRRLFLCWIRNSLRHRCLALVSRTISVMTQGSRMFRTLLRRGNMRMDTRQPGEMRAESLWAYTSRARKT